MAEIKLTLNPPLNNEYYSSDDLISGSVVIDIKKSMSIKIINVKLKGYVETITKMNSEYMYAQNGLMSPVQDNRSIHGILDIDQRVFPPDNVFDALEGSTKPFKVKPGSYEYTFQFPQLPKRPTCINNHYKDIDCFLKKAETRLPPSFNYQWQDLSKIDNLDIYFYSFGKVLYYVQVQLELGKPKAWYKPFNRFFTETEYFDFIPEVKSLMYKVDYSKSTDLNIVEYTKQNLNNSAVTGKDSNKRRLLRPKDQFIIPHNIPELTSETALINSLQEAMLVDPNISVNGDALPSFSNIQSPAYNNEQSEITVSSNSVASNVTDSRHLIYKSTYSINVADDKSVMWLEVRSRGLKYTYRRDYLFRQGSNKFDHIYMVFKGKIESLKKINIQPLKLQLNLLEYTTYLSQGIANENISSLRLIEVDELNSSENSKLVNFGESILTPDADTPTNKDQETGKIECELKLKDHDILKRLRFNKENYMHRGNRLYSFKCCTIKRIFKFQLVVSWKVNGLVVQTENIIDNAQIFTQPREKIRKVENLPRYVEPPTYTEVTVVDKPA